MSTGENGQPTDRQAASIWAQIDGWNQFMVFRGTGGPSFGFAPTVPFDFAMWLEIIRDLGREASMSAVVFAGQNGFCSMKGCHFWFMDQCTRKLDSE